MTSLAFSHGTHHAGVGNCSTPGGRVCYYCRCMDLRRFVRRRGHPLATNEFGKIRRSRYILYEKLGGVAGICNWCSAPLTWKTLCADHLDSDIANDTPSNLVGSCRGCNANRDDGTGYGRQKPKHCERCDKEYIGRSHHNSQRFCSISCASFSQPKRPIRAQHGTRSRYMRKCRCSPCKMAQSAYSKIYNEIRRKRGSPHVTAPTS